MPGTSESYEWCDTCAGQHHLWGPKQRALRAWMRGDGAKDKLRDVQLLNDWRNGRRHFLTGEAYRSGKKTRTVSRGICATRTGRFTASLTVHGLPHERRRMRHIGTYDTPMEAIAARDKAEGVA